MLRASTLRSSLMPGILPALVTSCISLVEAGYLVLELSDVNAVANTIAASDCLETSGEPVVSARSWYSRRFARTWALTLESARRPGLHRSAR